MSTNRSKDRSSLCSFPFADGRHCRTLECGGLAAAFEAKAPAIHARKEAHRNNALCSLCSALCALCGKSFSSITRALSDFPRLQIAAKASLQTALRPRLTTFRINTCKSVSKQRTLTPFRMNTCEKGGEGGSQNQPLFLASPKAKKGP